MERRHAAERSRPGKDTHEPRPFIIARFKNFYSFCMCVCVWGGCQVRRPVWKQLYGYYGEILIMMWETKHFSQRSLKVQKSVLIFSRLSHKCELRWHFECIGAQVGWHFIEIYTREDMPSLIQWKYHFSRFIPSLRVVEMFTERFPNKPTAKHVRAINQTLVNTFKRHERSYGHYDRVCTGENVSGDPSSLWPLAEEGGKKKKKNERRRRRRGSDGTAETWGWFIKLVLV